MIRCWLFVLLVGSSLAAGYCHANDRDAEKAKTQQQLQQLQKQIQAVKSKLDQTRKQASSAEKQLKQTELEIGESAKQLRHTERQIAQTETKLGGLRGEQKQLQLQKQLQTQALEKQIRSAYITGRQEYLKLLLSQENPAILGRVLTMYRYLNQARAEEIDRLQQTISKLIKVEQDIVVQLDRLQTLFSEQTKHNQTLLALKAKRQQVVATLKAEAKTEDSKLNNLLANEQQLKQVIEELSRVVLQVLPAQELKGLAKLKGKLLWPAKGRIQQKYGSRRNKRGSTWNGVVLAATEGSEVSAIHHGRVVFSDWLRGFGLLTIIDHGDNYMSLYAFNQSLLKNVGDNVEAGEPIAIVGQSGGQDQPGVYFELRHRSKPINPMYWIRR